MLGLVATSQWARDTARRTARVDQPRVPRRARSDEPPKAEPGAVGVNQGGGATRPGRRWPSWSWTTSGGGRSVSNLGLSFGRSRRCDASPAGRIHGRAGRPPRHGSALHDDCGGRSGAPGLVERQPHPTDRRVKLVETTALGKEAARQARAIMNRPPAELAALPEAELAALLRGLRAIRHDPATPVIGLPEDRIPPPKR